MTCDSDDGLLEVGVVVLCGDGVVSMRNESDDMDEPVWSASSKLMLGRGASVAIERAKRGARHCYTRQRNAHAQVPLYLRRGDQSDGVF